MLTGCASATRSRTAATMLRSSVTSISVIGRVRPATTSLSSGTSSVRNAR
ncbi:Uncharacterised protein [Mycobacteroides abscessus subsp. abscessus]|nr:Uncharacterised protein [Mycobacteroides abscessus subsp. abscessus]